MLENNRIILSKNGGRFGKVLLRDFFYFYYPQTRNPGENFVKSFSLTKL